jgi:hypothetical protein
MTITKLDVAEREIVAAVRLLFNGGDPVAVYVLASAARAITTALCEHRGVRSFLDDARQSHPHLSKKDIYNLANRHAGFLKHADRDPDAVLYDFDDGEADAVLYVAVSDFWRLYGGIPIEARAFAIWFDAHVDPAGHGKEAAEVLVGIETMSRPQQLELGKVFVAWARTQPDLHMPYSTK